jgi:hypothetical protein
MYSWITIKKSKILTCPRMRRSSEIRWPSPYSECLKLGQAKLCIGKGLGWRCVLDKLSPDYYKLLIELTIKFSKKKLPEFWWSEIQTVQNGPTRGTKALLMEGKFCVLVFHALGRWNLFNHVLTLVLQSNLLYLKGEWRTFLYNCVCACRRSNLDWSVAVLILSFENCFALAPHS